MMMMIHRELRLHRPNWFSPFLDTHGMNSIETTTSIEDMTRDSSFASFAQLKSQFIFGSAQTRHRRGELCPFASRWWPHSRETWGRPNRQRPPFLRRLFASHPAILKSLPRDDIFFRLLLCVVLLLRVLRADDDYFRQQQPQSKRQRQRLYYFIKYVGIYSILRTDHRAHRAHTEGDQWPRVGDMNST